VHGFCKITDLGILHFNFSSNNCSSKVYTCFGKVVVLVTQSTTKLGFIFWIFLRFYIEFTSFCYNTQRGEDSFCEWPLGTFQKITNRLLVCTKLPGTIWGFAMWSKGARGGATGRIPAMPAAGLAGEVASMEEGFTLARLVTGVWAEMSPASSHGGAGWRWSRAVPMPAMHGQRRMVRGRRGSRDIRGGVEVVGRQWNQAGGEAPRVPTMAEQQRSSLARTQCARPANACYLNRRGTLLKKSRPPRTSG
jgi:hypothetical protein